MSSHRRNHWPRVKHKRHISVICVNMYGFCGHQKIFHVVESFEYSESLLFICGPRELGTTERCHQKSYWLMILVLFCFLSSDGSHWVTTPDQKRLGASVCTHIAFLLSEYASLMASSNDFRKDSNVSFSVLPHPRLFNFMLLMLRVVRFPDFCRPLLERPLAIANPGIACNIHCRQSLDWDKSGAVCGSLICLSPSEFLASHITPFLSRIRPHHFTSLA